MNEDELDQPVKVFVEQHNKYVEITNFTFKKGKTTSTKSDHKLTLVAEDPEKIPSSSYTVPSKDNKNISRSPFTLGDGDGDYFIWTHKE